MNELGLAKTYYKAIIKVNPASRAYIIIAVWNFINLVIWLQFVCAGLYKKKKPREVPMPSKY